MKKFSTNTIQKIKYYVYFLTWLEDDKKTIIYVGKGMGNRVWGSKKSKEKELNKKCNAYIIKSGLSEKEAFELESILINVVKVLKWFDLKNKIFGKHKFDISRVEEVERKHTKSINLQEYAENHNLSFLGIKINTNSYMSTFNKDHRGSLEGIWRLNPSKLESVDYVLGIYNQSIFGVYKYAKGSYQKIDSSLKESDFKKWLNRVGYFGRNKDFFEYNYSSFSKISSMKRVIFELIPLAISLDQESKIDNKYLSTNNVKKDIDFLFNKNISDKKINGQNPILWFNVE